MMPGSACWPLRHSKWLAEPGMPFAVQFMPPACAVGRCTDSCLADLCRADVKAFLEDGETVRLLVSLEGKDLAVVSRMRPAVSS